MSDVVVDPPQEVNEAPAGPEIKVAVSTVDESQVDKSKAIKFNGEVKPNKKATADNEEDRVHSVTFYIRRKSVKFYMEGLKEVARSIYGVNPPTGKVSRYIRSLVNKDFIARGLLTADGEPDHEALANLKYANHTASTEVPANN